MNATLPSRESLEAWRALVNTSVALMQRLDDDLHRFHNLSLAEYDVLITLANAPERRLRHQDLLSHARLTKSGLSRLADRMEADGLIRTERCPSDRRGAFAVLTALGKRRLQAAARTHSAGIESLFGRHLDNREAASLTAMLARVTTALTGPSTGCPATSGTAHTETSTTRV